MEGGGGGAWPSRIVFQQFSASWARPCCMSCCSRTGSSTCGGGREVGVMEHVEVVAAAGSSTSRHRRRSAGRGRATGRKQLLQERAVDVLEARAFGEDVGAAGRGMGAADGAARERRRQHTKGRRGRRRSSRAPTSPPPSARPGAQREGRTVDCRRSLTRPPQTAAATRAWHRARSAHGGGVGGLRVASRGRR